MLGGINPKKMQAMMKQMGMSQEEIDASKVIIEKSDGSKVIIQKPSVQKVKFQGQTTWQISGEAVEENEKVEISEEDVKTIMEKTNCDKEIAKKTLNAVEGDLAEAILKLNE